MSGETLYGDTMMEKVGLLFEVIRSRQNKCYFDSRLFEVAESKVLIDTTSS